MKFLLIEDDPNKSKQMIEFLHEAFPNYFVELKKSYQSGLKEIMEKEYDLILLDMQLPTFDIKSGEDGYKFRKLAGRDILSELKRKKKNCKVVIVTQFETFGEGESYIELKDLKKILREEYRSYYVDTVFYNAAQSKWKHELIQIINKYFNKK
jgi:DNA-binding NarL/FixJ family response regulator